MAARVELFGVEIDSLAIDQAAAQIMAWVTNPTSRCQLVVTPGVDDVVMLQYHAGLRAAYASAGMVLAHGTPVLWSSRLLKQPLPQGVGAVELLATLFATRF